MTNVMKMAWVIANEGQSKFGGSVTEYIAEALKMAWAKIKGGSQMKVKKEYTDSWAAEITGLHPEYHFNRNFIEAENNWWSLEEGKIYQINNIDRKYVKVEGDKLIKLTSKEVSDHFTPSKLKSLPQLQGSSAQIKWAERIRMVYMNNIDELLAIAEKVKDNVDEQYRDSAYARLIEQVEEQKVETSAKDWIEKFQDLTREHRVSELHTLSRKIRGRVTREVAKHIVEAARN